MQCLERGQIALDDEVERHLPELANPVIIAPAAVGEADPATPFRLIPAKGKITLRQLLTHTSGFGYDMFDPLMLSWRASRAEPPMGLSGRVVAAYSTPLRFEPGQGWAYGGGVDWAGVLVSRLNDGISLEAYVQEHICRPLGMSSTTFRLQERPLVKSRLMDMTVRMDDGTLIPGQSPFPDPAMDDVGGAGIYTSVPDYLELLDDLIRERPRILRKETVAEMFKPQLDLASPAAQALVENNAIVSSMTGSGSYEDGMNFGLGGCLSLKDLGVMRKATLAWGGMPNITWFANREHGVAGIYATQLLPPGDLQSAQMVQRFIDEVYGYAAEQARH